MWEEEMSFKTRVRGRYGSTHLQSLIPVRDNVSKNKVGDIWGMIPEMTSGLHIHMRVQPHKWIHVIHFYTPSLLLSPSPLPKISITQLYKTVTQSLNQSSDHGLFREVLLCLGMVAWEVETGGSMCLRPALVGKRNPKQNTLNKQTKLNLNETKKEKE